MGEPKKTINAYCWSISLTDDDDEQAYEFSCVAQQDEKCQFNVECEQEINYDVFVRLVNVLSKIYHYQQQQQQQQQVYHDVSTEGVAKVVNSMASAAAAASTLTAKEKLIADTYKFIVKPPHVTSCGGGNFDDTLIYDMLNYY